MERRKCCTATRTATPTNISEKLTHSEQNTDVSSTIRTRANTGEQLRLSPPFEPLRYYSLPLGSIHHSLILLGSHSVAKGTLFHQKTINSIGQKWTKIALPSLDTPTNPPASRAKKAPSEVQILSPRPRLKQEAFL